MSVGIIGGGPAGFAVARALAAEPKNFKITILERRSTHGGVWQYTGKGPLYKDLDTNIYSQLMEFKNYPFKTQPEFVFRDEVYDYVAKYSQDVASLPNVNVKFDTEAIDLQKDTQTNKWQVKTKTEHLEFDFVVIAAGHYEFPNLPPIPGLETFKNIHHTKDYFEPSIFKNQKGLVVGNSSSGVDVAIQLLRVTAPLTISRLVEAKSDAAFEAEDVIWKPEISKIENQNVYFADGTMDTFDFIMFATGYKYEQPLLTNLNHPVVTTLPILQPDFARFQNLHKYVFYIGDPTLAFVSLNTQIIPMPFSEAQGAVIARVWANRLSLPSQSDMLEEEAHLVAEKGDGANYVNMGFPADTDYMAALNSWADTAGADGFHAEKWGDYKLHLRGNIYTHKLQEYRRKILEAREMRKNN